MQMHCGVKPLRYGTQHRPWQSFYWCDGLAAGETVCQVSTVLQPRNLSEWSVSFQIGGAHPRWSRPAARGLIRLIATPIRPSPGQHVPIADSLYVLIGGRPHGAWQ